MSSNTENNKLDSMLVHKATPEYLQDLLKDKKQLQNFPNIFLHLEIILEKEITRVREKLFHLNESYKKTENELPEPIGTITTLQEKVFVPVKENPNYNFVGRLLGPRGLTAKQLEQDLECKIMVRGRGSLRDKKKEDMNRGKPNWEHLDEDLHVLVSVEDFENRAAIKLRRATETIRAFLEQGVRTPENEDRLKQLQLMELAVLNDKDRQQAQAAHQVQQHQQLVLQHQSLTVLNNQAVAAAAAAQLLQSSPYHTSPLLSRLSGQTGSTALGNYIPSSVLPNVLCPLSSSPSLPVGPGVNLNGQIGLGLSLQQQLPGSSTSVTMASLGFPVAQTSSVSPNLISCTPAPTQDQLNAMAAALFTSGAASSVANTVHLSNGKLSVQGPNRTPQLYPVTSLASPLMEAVNILDYNAAAGAVAQNHLTESLKMRNVPTSVSQHRVHPYLRP
ncbi:Kh-domain rna binding protein [Fasciola hepatica]|uniref:Kh-domain rna binding protein n=1 Tax=Fasciola hepatica TaxID=6192 RepID=A0A4E0RG59_FASHE|nr:Kh-domain rna binding protein [Fasciola hepatica]